MSTGNPSTTEPGRALFEEMGEAWRRQPDKLLFFSLLAPWVALFHFLGNSTLGYVKTDSLFGWMYFVFTTSADDNYCLYIPLVVLALFWWKRRALGAVPKGNWWPALVLVVAALFLHAVGFLIQQTRVSVLAFFAGGYGLMGLVWGRRFMSASFFPMFLLVFCVPLGTVADTLTFPLRLLSTKLKVLTCHGPLGIAVVQNGTALFEPTGKYRYEVAAACSGLRSVTALFALTTIYGFMTFQKPWKRLLMMAAAFPLAVASNVVRLVMIIVAAETFGQSAGNYVHESSWLSLLPYLLAMAGFLVLAHFLREKAPAPAPAAPAAVAPMMP
jgi:exosortase